MRRTVAGSTREARHAGTKHAIIATPNRSPMTPANTPGSRVWWHTNWSGLVVRRRWRGASLRQPRRTRERDHRAASAAGRVLVAPRVPAGCPNLALYNDFQLYNLPEGGARPEQVRATISSWDLFATLGVQPSIGRCFTPERRSAFRATLPSSSVGLFGNAALAATLPSSVAKSI